ncbi:MAG: Membrane protein, partial [Frankiales bacterium]|nr:Membrane protein [Frankiales bacterium]
SVLSVVLFIAGVAMFAYPVGTDLYSRYEQSKLNNAFGDPALRQKYLNRTIAVGDVLTELQIPKIHLNVLVVEGTTPAALRAGAGHYPSTPLPGEAGNVGIAGHRTTFGRPFNHIDELGPGDQVILITPFKKYHYVAVRPFDGHSNPWVTTPTDFSVVQDVPGQSLLTLTSCNPKGSARQRIVLRLQLQPQLTEDVNQGKAKGART